jgi:hypothetical protein
MTFWSTFSSDPARTVTGMVCSVVPGEKVIVPLVAVKLVPATAEPLLVVA